MKRAIELGIIAIACLCLFVNPATPQQGGKVLLIVRDVKLPAAADLELAITKEAGVMKEMLQRAEYTVVLASPTGESWGTPPNTLKPDLKLSDVRVADYRGFVIPCLAISNVAFDPDLAKLIKSAVEMGKPLAAQTAGVRHLAKAGVLSGKKYALIESATIYPEFKDGIYSGTGVVRDGKIITSGICPVMARTRGMEDGTPKLMEALIAELKLSK